MCFLGLLFKTLIFLFLAVSVREIFFQSRILYDTFISVGSKRGAGTQNVHSEIKKVKSKTSNDSESEKKVN